MRILILGNNHSTQSFFDLFNKNKENIVFSTTPNCNQIIFSSNVDILDFAIANDINLVLITDEKYIDSDICESLEERNITIFSPNEEASLITSSKSYAKKFMYKSQIPTARFQIFDKPAMAFEYVRNLKIPLAIKPDEYSDKECTQFCETIAQAEKIIDNLFKNNNKKIIIEDYIEGKNIEIFVLSDGFKFQILGISAKYQNNVAYFEPEFLNEEIINNIMRDVISPTIDNLAEQESEYIGILGFDIILKQDNSFFLVGYNNFFDDLDVDFYTQGFDVNWLEIFESTIVGDVFLKYEINPKNEFMATIRQNNEIHFVSAKTKHNLELYLEELYDNSEYKEASKIWES